MRTRGPRRAARGPGAVHPVRGEFVDPELERGFRLHALERDARRLPSILVFSSLVFAAFGVLDLLDPEWDDVTWLTLAMRVGLVAAAATLAYSVRRRPERSLDWVPVTAVEAYAMVTFLLIAYYDPLPGPTRSLQFAILSVAMLIYVPNRLLPALSVVAVGTAAFSWVGLQSLDGSSRLDVEAILTLAVAMVVGGSVAWMLQRSRRDEYLSFVHEQGARVTLEQEVEQRAALQGELEWLATHDTLTDLLNRRAFFELADTAFAASRRNGRPLSVLVIDADDFKAINDRFGHHTGDEVIRTVARLCRLHLRADDVVGRLGGEEFAVVMPATGLDRAHEIADRLRERIAEAGVTTPHGVVRLTVSIGVSECRPWEETSHDSLQRADAAMYEAKGRGRNRVVPS